MRPTQKYYVKLVRPSTASFLTIEVEAYDFDHAAGLALKGMEGWYLEEQSYQPHLGEGWDA
jgi:hypothetical protein